jgi:puromycin-sensitive aminopeptidase
MGEREPEERYRLPRTVVPTRYDLTLEPDLDAGTFDGAVQVALEVREPVTEIVLNANELRLDEATLAASNDRRIEVSKIRTDDDAERATLDLAETAEPGTWILATSFRGELNPRLTGFYRSTYDGEDGRTQVVGTTHFEATDARRAFPCWDEPDLKAVFAVTLVVEDGLVAVSNGPEREREPLGDGRVRIRFADTMKMSTYLAAWVVGRLELSGPADARGVPIRTVHVPGKQHLTGFASEVSVHSLNWFADYYGIPYPEAKLDNVAIPDFAQGAMENVGCVTYREQVLLIDPARSTQEEQLGVAETVAHELAHMWFGDLVTMRWWNGIWLNEAFATFMSMLAVDDFRPDWEIWNTFARDRTNAFEVDALETTRPIEYEVRSPNDASGMFDTLTYVKGGAVLRMLEQWLGGERFRDGIRRYLAQHAYGNTETHDLWDALEEETGEPVRRIMDAWIFQPGYPAISVGIDGDRVRFSQGRFLPSRDDDDTTWPVPLTVRQVSGTEERLDRILIEAGGAELGVLAPDAAIVANAGSASFVRVWYDDELRSRVVARAMDVLSPIERYGLVDDAWAAVVAGEASAGSFLDLVQGLRNETDLRVWQAILGGLGWFDRFVEGEARERLRAFVRDLVRPALARLGWEAAEDESDLTRALRGQIVQSLAVLGADPETLAQCRELELEGEGDPQLLQAAVEAVAAEGTAEDLDRYWRRYRSATTPQEEERYLFATARFPGEAEIDRLLAASMTDEVRTQDAPYLLARSTTNRQHGPTVWRFIADRWDEMQDRFAASNIIALVSGIRYLTDPEVVDEVDAFFREHDIPQNRLMLRQGLERMRVAARLRERVTPELLQRFGS